MKELNEYLIDDGNDFIKFWNRCITDCGCITVADVKDVLIDPNNPTMYTDTKYGWTEFINTTNLIVVENGNQFAFKLNLPKPKEL